MYKRLKVAILVLIFIVIIIPILLLKFSSDDEISKDNNKKISSVDKNDIAENKDIHDAKEIEKPNNDVQEKPDIKGNSSMSNQVINVETIDDYKVIVNKKHPLDRNYRPGENPVAKKALLKLIGDMQRLGYPISNSYSGFRTYQRQSELYNRYVREDGKAKADTYSARPGYSEHQTGLTFDIKDRRGRLLGNHGINNSAANWLAQNAHRYGFVVRYQRSKEHITGYKAEPWHIRFIGNDAVKVYERGQCLEEFYGVEGGDYIK